MLEAVNATLAAEGLIHAERALDLGTDARLDELHLLGHLEQPLETVEAEKR